MGYPKALPSEDGLAKPEILLGARMHAREGERNKTTTDGNCSSSGCLPTILVALRSDGELTGSSGLELLQRVRFADRIVLAHPQSSASDHPVHAGCPCRSNGRNRGDPAPRFPWAPGREPRSRPVDAGNRLQLRPVHVENNLLKLRAARQDRAPGGQHSGESAQRDGRVDAARPGHRHPRHPVRRLTAPRTPAPPGAPDRPRRKGHPK